MNKGVTDFGAKNWKQLKRFVVKIFTKENSRTVFFILSAAAADAVASQKQSKQLNAKIETGLLCEDKKILFAII